MSSLGDGWSYSRNVHGGKTVPHDELPSALRLYREFFSLPATHPAVEQYHSMRSDGFFHASGVRPGSIVKIVKDPYGSNQEGNFRQDAHHRPIMYRCFGVSYKDGYIKRFCPVGSRAEQEFTDKADNYMLDLGETEGRHIPFALESAYSVIVTHDPFMETFRKSTFVKLDLSEEDIQKIRAAGEAKDSLEDFVGELFKADEEELAVLLGEIGVDLEEVPEASRYTRYGFEFG